ncbi:MAG: hypothetical protein H8D87_00910 [Deltaproteobacteria bacterium]|nr:hypothetical protein [Candidatus Desulfobacula maris]
MDPDYLFLEPSEMIVTRELRDVVNMGLRDLKYGIGPFITLIDGPSFSFHWEERPKLIQGQIQDADIVALSKTDRIDSIKIKQICDTLNLPEKNLLLLGQKNRSAITELAQEILSINQEQ